MNMKYKLRNNYSTNPENALISILKDRGVQDINNFLNPSFDCELNPYDLENIQEDIIYESNKINELLD